MIDSAMVNIGAAFMLIGGVALVAIVLGLAVYAAGLAWIAASNKWRDILRAESLIYEYRMNREAYIEWRRKANKTRDNAVPVVRCKDCEHYDMGVCLKIYSDGNVHLEAWQERKPDDFCSYGERREDA
nr:MAG TPA: hypothetical protein [Bacteriophage sp.]